MAKFLILICSLFFVYCSEFNNFFSNKIIQTENKPIVVITFDDAHETVYTKGFKIMEEFDSSWKATHFYPLKYLNAPHNITLTQAQEMEKAGWENGGHGVWHENLSSIPFKEAKKQIVQVADYFKNNNLKLDSWAYVFGNYNDSIRWFLSKYVKNIRTSHDYHYKNMVERKELGYFAVRGFHTVDDVIARIVDSEINNEKLVIIGFHIIIDDDGDIPDVYYTKESVYRGLLKYLKDNNFKVMTVRDAMNRLFDNS